MNKKELIKILRREQQASTKCHGGILIIEQKKLSQELGILKFEVYLGNELEYTAGLTIPLDESTDSAKKESAWNKLKVGQSEYWGLYLQARGKSLMEKMREFFKRSFEEGKIQDLLGLIK